MIAVIPWNFVIEHANIVSNEASIGLYRRRSSHSALWNDDDNGDDGDDAVAASSCR